MKPQHIIATIIFLILATLLVTMSERSVRDIQATYYKAVSPFIRSGTKYDKSIQLFLSEVKSSKLLESRLKAVESQFGQLQATKARFLQIEQENKRLRNALGFKERSKFELVSSKILRRKPSSWWETITIDKGESDGIATQFPVISEYGLVGKIDRVSENMSTALLITDQSCLVSAKVEGTPEFGIISGQRGKYGEEALLRLKYLTKDISAEPGTRVVTSGIGGVFPDSIEIGTIVSIHQGALYAEAVVKPSFSMQDSEVIFTVKMPQK